MSDDRYAEFAKQFGDGRHVIEECVRCGSLRWSVTYTTEPNGYTLQKCTYIEHCPACAYVAKRNPELFEWVLRVVQHTALAAGEGK